SDGWRVAFHLSGSDEIGKLRIEDGEDVVRRLPGHSPYVDTDPAMMRDKIQRPAAGNGSDAHLAGLTPRHGCRGELRLDAAADARQHLGHVHDGVVACFRHRRMRGT